MAMQLMDLGRKAAQIEDNKTQLLVTQHGFKNNTKFSHYGFSNNDGVRVPSKNPGNGGASGAQMALPTGPNDLIDYTAPNPLIGYNYTRAVQPFYFQMAFNLRHFGTANRMARGVDTRGKEMVLRLIQPPLTYSNADKLRVMTTINAGCQYILDVSNGLLRRSFD